MSESKHTPGTERAVEGMLREYLRAGKGDDEQMVARIMGALEDVEIKAPRSLILRLWPAWAAVSAGPQICLLILSISS